MRGITIAIKQHLGWDKGKQPAGSRVMCRGITGDKLHTWAGLVGYCCKDMHEPHFQVCHSEVLQTLNVIQQPLAFTYMTAHVCDTGGHV